MSVSLSEAERHLGQALVAARQITPGQLESAIGEKHARGPGKSLGPLLVELGYLGDDVLAGTLVSFGEKVVLRLLDRERSVVPLGKLGLSRHNREISERLTREPYGMLLVTGPTGSGKTTTLYPALATLDTVRLNIITVEDPVEYQLPRINQVPINAKRGLRFATRRRATSPPRRR